MEGNLILAFLVFYPFLGAFATYLAGRGSEKATFSAAASGIFAGRGGKQGKLRDHVADFVVISEFLVMLLVLIFQSGSVEGVLQSVAAAGEDGPTAVIGVSLGAHSLHIANICGLGLNFTLDGFRLLYGLIATFMWMMTTIMSGEYFGRQESGGRSHGAKGSAGKNASGGEDHTNRFYLFLLLTLGATMGVFLSEDLFTTFIFFEIMSFTSYVWVAQEENAAALRAAETYLAVAVIGGLVLLMGLFILYQELGTLTMSELLAAADECPDQTLLYAAGGCILVGFGAKAGAFPLHIWLPKAHPVAPAPASALLSGILTKSGIFGILVITGNLFPYDEGWGELLLGIGVLTMFGGALLAVFSIDLKRTLACSSMSQIGFILVGVGMQSMLGESALAVHGTFLHMANHSLIKLVLFMAAGVIFMNAHALDLNEIRGFGRNKALLKVIFLTGALAIGGIPFFGGYISKTLLHESILEYGGGWVMKLVEYVFLLSGGLTIAYMTKLYVAVFVEENSDRKLQQKYDGMKRYMNQETTFALAGSALVLFIWGFFPAHIMNPAAKLAQGFLNLSEYGEEVRYFSLSNLSGALISIVIGVLVYLFVIRRLLMRQEQAGKKRTAWVYINAWPAWWDLENVIYRPVLLRFLPLVFGIVCRVLDSVLDGIVVFLRRTIYRDSPLPHERLEGNVLTSLAGTCLNLFQRLRNATWGKRDPVQRDYRHVLAYRQAKAKESSMLIQRSLSYGLALFGIGLTITLIYLIWM